MSQALYRKYRSQRFAELVGQDSVTRILRNSIVRERLSHAYLFCGPRGTGKTSVARIFAKAVNCLAPNDGDACGECFVCRAVAEGGAVDVVEIDAASNRGIDDIRELRERVNYAPLELKYKVYIIDEVHMITTAGFNALLKTLEEPPSHVIFCLCTTEAHKLPITILSRCIRFDFHRLPQQALADHLVWMAGEESFKLSDEAAQQLAELAEGSARDAISLLDQLMVYCDGDITLEAIHELFQLGDPQLAPRTVDGLAGDDPAPVLEVWDRLVEQGADAGQFLLKVADELKQRYLADRSPGWRAALEAIWQGVNLLKFESFPAVLVELTLLNAQAACHNANARPATSAASVAREQSAAPPVQRREAPSQAAGHEPQRRPAVSRTAPPPARTKPPEVKQPTVEAGPGPAAPPPAAEAPAPDPAEKPRVEPSPAAPVTPPAPAGPEWEEYVRELKAVRKTAYALVRSGVAGRLDAGMFCLEFDNKAVTAFRYAQQAETAKALVAVAEKQFGGSVGVVLKRAASPDEAVLKPAAAATSRARPVPVEIVEDIVNEGEDAGRFESTVDPGTMEQIAEEMSGEIKADTEADRGGQPPTRQDFDSLFEPIDLDA